MKSWKNPLLFALLIGGIVGVVAGCNNAKSTIDANAAQENEPEKAAAAASDAAATNSLPQPDPTFHGKIGDTYHDSTADKSMFDSPTAPEGAPNILLVLIDDAGFGATGKE